MRILFLVPANHPQTGGNRVTVHRLAGSLAARGVESVCVDADEATARQAAEFDLVHAFNAYKSGVAAANLCAELHLPLVVTITGTDLNQELQRRDRREAVVDVLERSDAVVAFHEEARRALLEEAPAIEDRLTVIAPAVELPDGSGKGRQEQGLAGTDFLFFLPSGLRAVKNPLFAVSALRRLRRDESRIKLWLAGPVIEQAIADELRAAIEGEEWIRYLGEVPWAAMADLYVAADVVLNTSHSEGLANALLEAMGLGRPILAADIPGNRAIIDDDEDGLLYGDRREFLHQAYRLLREPGLAQRLGERAAAKVAARHAPAAEAEAHLRLYSLLIDREALHCRRS